MVDEIAKWLSDSIPTDVLGVEYVEENHFKAEVYGNNNIVAMLMAAGFFWKRIEDETIWTKEFPYESGKIVVDIVTV